MILEQSEQAGIGGGSGATRPRPELHVVQTAVNPPVISVEAELGAGVSEDGDGGRGRKPSTSPSVGEQLHT